jgi:hypothetical protein
VLEAVIGGAVVLLIIVGFWWTRGSGGLPGGTDDPAREELRKYNELGDRVPTAGEVAKRREREIE